MWSKKKVLLYESLWQLPWNKAKVICFSDKGAHYRIQVYYKWFFKWVLRRDLTYTRMMHVKNEIRRIEQTYHGIDGVLLSQSKANHPEKPKAFS